MSSSTNANVPILQIDSPSAVENRRGNANHMELPQPGYIPISHSYILHQEPAPSEDSDSGSEISIEFEFPTELPSKFVPLSEMEESQRDISPNRIYLDAALSVAAAGASQHHHVAISPKGSTNKRQRSSPLHRDMSHHKTLFKQVAQHTRKSFSQSPKPVSFAGLKFENIMRDIDEQVDNHDLAPGLAQLKQMQFEDDASYLNEKLDIKRIQFQNAVMDEKDMVVRNRKIYHRLTDVRPKVDSGTRSHSGAMLQLSQSHVPPGTVELVEVPQYDSLQSPSQQQLTNKNLRRSSHQQSPSNPFSEYLTHPKRHSVTSNKDPPAASASPSRRPSAHHSNHQRIPSPPSMGTNPANALTPFQKATLQKNLEKEAKRYSPNAPSIPQSIRRPKNNFLSKGIYMRHFSNNLLLSSAAAHQTNFMAQIGKERMG